MFFIRFFIKRLSLLLHLDLKYENIQLQSNYWYSFNLAKRFSPFLCLLPACFLFSLECHSFVVFYVHKSSGRVEHVTEEEGCVNEQIISSYLSSIQFCCPNSYENLPLFCPSCLPLGCPWITQDRRLGVLAFKIHFEKSIV